MTNQDPQAAAKKHRLQLEILIKDGEYKKNAQKLALLDMEIRQNKRKADLLRIETEKSKAEAGKLTFVQANLEKEIKNLKKDLAGQK